MESTVKLVSSDWFDISFWQPTYFHFFHGISWLIICKFCFIFGIFLLWILKWSSVISFRLSVVGFLRTWGEVLEICLEVDQNNLYTSVLIILNRLTPNDPYMGRTALLTSKRWILYIYSTNIGTEYFKHVLYSPIFSLQNAVCFIMLTSFVPVLFTFYIQDVLKLKKIIIPAPKG